MEIGGVLGTFLFGIETLQTFNYYRDSPKDSKLLKAAVRLSVIVLAGLLTLRVSRSALSGELSGHTTKLPFREMSRVLELAHTIVAWHAVRKTHSHPRRRLSAKFHSFILKL